MIRVAIIFILIHVLGVVSTDAASPIEISDVDRKIYVEETEQYVDTNSMLTYNDFVNNKYLFERPSKYLYGTRNKDYTYWISFDLTGEMLGNDLFYILCNDSRVSHMEIWFNGELQAEKPSGTSYLYSNRNINHRFLVNRLPQTKDIEVVIKIQSNQMALFAFEIKEQDEFLEDSYWESGLLGGAYGIIILGLIFSFMMRLRFRERIYDSYVFFAVVAILTCLFLDGSGFQFFWNNYPSVNLYFLLLLPLLVLSCSNLIVLSFIGIWNRKHPYFKIIIGGFLFSLIGYVFVFTMPHYYIHGIFYMVSFITMLYVCILSYKEGFKSILVFIIGFVFLTFANIFYMLHAFFPVEHYHPLTRFSSHFSVVAMTLALTYSQFKKFFLISKSRDKEKQKSILHLEEINTIKDRIHNEIAEKVSLQTKELEQKNEIIHQQNAELQFAHDKLKEQTDEIIILNLKLNQENQELKSDVQKITESRIFQSVIPFEDFKTFFENDESCYELLEELKWSKGFECSKCKNTKFGKGKGVKARRCTKCGANESVISNTIFHRIHFPILKAFYMLFLVNKHGDNLISKDLSDIVDLRLATCWKFSKKIKAHKEVLEQSGVTIESWMDLI